VPAGRQADRLDQLILPQALEDPLDDVRRDPQMLGQLLNRRLSQVKGSSA
jgi:hypothetical protein